MKYVLRRSIVKQYRYCWMIGYTDSIVAIGYSYTRLGARISAKLAAYRFVRLARRGRNQDDVIVERDI